MYWDRGAYSIQKLECTFWLLCERVKVMMRSYKGVFTNMIFSPRRAERYYERGSTALSIAVRKRPQTAYQTSRRCRPSSPDGANCVTRRECVTWPADSQNLAPGEIQFAISRTPFHCKSTWRRHRDVISDSSISLALFYLAYGAWQREPILTTAYYDLRPSYDVPYVRTRQSW